MKYVLISRDDKIYSIPLHKLELQTKDLKIATKTEDGNIKLSKSSIYKACVLRECLPGDGKISHSTEFYPTTTGEHFILKSIWVDGLGTIAIHDDGILFIASSDNKSAIRQVKAGAAFHEEGLTVHHWITRDLHDPFGPIAFGKDFSEDEKKNITLCHKDGDWHFHNKDKKNPDNNWTRKIELEE